MGPSAETAQSFPSWRYWLPRIASAILFPLLLLGITEAALRIGGVGTSTSVTVPCKDQGRLAFCDNPSFTVPFFPTGMARAPRPYTIPAAKPPGTFRIFILGESAALGDPDPTYAFSRYLEMMLRERFPGIKFEVINTAITAINSHVVLRLTEDMAQHQPDLFIVYTGNNEVIGPFGPGTVLTSAALNRPAIRANIFMSSTRIGQLVARVVRPKGLEAQEWRGMEMFLKQQVRGNSPAMGHVYDNFAANLRDIIAVARASGARVVASTVATNLKDCAPFGSLHREGLGQDSLRSWSTLVGQGAWLESAGNYAEALKFYLSAAEIDDQYAELQFRIARCLWMQGDYASAKQRFLRSRDLDTLHFREDSRMNDIIRSVAASAGSGVEMVDAAEIFAQESPHGVPGSELLYDHVHMNPRGNYLLARALFPTVVSALPPEVRHSASLDAPSEAECERLLALTDYDRSRVAELVLSGLAKAPFTNQLNHDEQVQRMSVEAEASNESWDDVVGQYLWAIAKNPDDRLLHLNYGFVLNLRDPNIATEQFRSALPYDNAPVLCNWRSLR